MKQDWAAIDRQLWVLESRRLQLEEERRDRWRVLELQAALLKAARDER